MLERLRGECKTLSTFEKRLNDKADFFAYYVTVNKALREKLEVIAALFIDNVNEGAKYADGFKTAFEILKEHPHAQLITKYDDLYIVTDGLPYREFVQHTFELYQHDSDVQELFDRDEED